MSDFNVHTNWQTRFEEAPQVSKGDAQLMQHLLAENMDLRARVAKLESALQLIAAPKRPDGTYNRSREACEQIARAALAAEETG